MKDLEIIEILRSQYLASLNMLKQAIVKCPMDAWDDPHDKDKVWYIAYHALYYAHKYLQRTDKVFVHWKKHRKPVTQSMLSREEMLEYLAFVKNVVAVSLPLTDLDAPCGFHAYPKINKLEMQLVNIRHIQQHTGELYDRLGTRRNVKFAWHGHVFKVKK